MKKIIFCIITALLLIVFFTGCNAAPPSDPNTISVYILEYDTFIQNCIENYNQKSTTIKVEPKIFKQSDFDRMYKELANKTICGKGPDLFIIDNRFFYNMDFRKMIGQECFADMNEIMDEIGFNHDEYNKKAFDAGIIDDKRIIVPYGYQVPFVMTTKQAFEGLCEIPESLSYKDIMRLEIDLLEQKQLPAVTIAGVSEIIFAEQINQFINGGSMDKEILSEAYSHTLTLSELGYDNSSIKFSYDDIISAKKAFCINPLLSYMHCEGFDIFESVCSDYCKAKYEYENDLVLIPLDENKTADIYKGFAINNNSTKKQQAFDFISYMISYKAQVEEYPKPYPCPYIPVNRKAYEFKKNKFLKFDYMYSGENTVLVEIPQELKKQLINIIESYENYDFEKKNDYIYQVLAMSMSKYDNLKDINIDNFIEDLTRDIEFYYSE